MAPPVPPRSAFASTLLVSTVLGAALLGSGCAQVLAIEVLPPRKSATCSAPGLLSNAAGSGVLDVAATETLHGAYVGDLRIAATGDLLVDGVNLAFTVPEGAGGDVTTAAEEAGGLQPLGDVLLVGSDDDVRQAVVEDVVLLPRELAIALREDGDLGLSATEYATVVVEIGGVQGEQPLQGQSGSFRIDVCDGCLTTPPAEEDCAMGVVEAPVCRPGQDVQLYECAAASGGLF